MAAAHVPSVVKAGAPNWEGVMELNEIFAGSDWTKIFEQILWLLALVFGFAAVVFKVFGRRLKGGMHLIRGGIGIAGYMGSMAFLSDGFRRIDYNMWAGKPGMLLENVASSVDEDAIIMACVIFLVSTVLLAWPAKKKDTKYIAVDNSNIGER